MLDRFQLRKEFDLFVLLLQHSNLYQHHDKRLDQLMLDRFLLRKEFDLFVMLSEHNTQHLHQHKKFDQSMLGRFLLHSQLHTLQNLKVHIFQQVNLRIDIFHIVLICMQYFEYYCLGNRRPNNPMIRHHPCRYQQAKPFVDLR